jgi:predicted metal-dependent phosphoesterase TrpH
MKAILHVHTFYSPDCIVPPERVVDAALADGADLLLVTDHDNFAGARAARREVERRGASLHVPIAAEILTELGDVIVVFENDIPGLDVVALKQFKFLVSYAQTKGGVLILPHPYQSHSDPEADAREVDAIEIFNGRCTTLQNSRASALVAATGKAAAYSADAHVLVDVCSVSAVYEGAASVDTLRLTPTPFRCEQTFKYRLAFAALTKAVRLRRPWDASIWAVSVARNLIQERLAQRSRLRG